MEGKGKKREELLLFRKNPALSDHLAVGRWEKVPVDDADHAVLAVVGAVDAQFVQQVQQQRVEVTVKLADGGFKAGVWLVAVHVLR